ncbi:MAG: hypothetical protein ACRD1G_12050, partial [Acidimicrobiales bacterium]
MTATAPAPLGTPSPDSEVFKSFVSVLIDAGRTQLASQLDGSKQWDAKALGVLTAIGAFGSFVFANHTSLG